MKNELMTHLDPKSPISEILRTLRTNIQFMNSNKQLKTLLLTSAMPGEGKTWVASNLAITFAQNGKRVVLIDADMRKGRIHKVFELQQNAGLSNYLSGIDDDNSGEDQLNRYLKKTEVPNLYVLPAGAVPPNPSELLGTRRMLNLLERLKQEFDLVIIDGTPSKLVTDAIILSRVVDSTMIVVAHNKTKKDCLDQIIKNLRNVGGNVIGIVYNQMPLSNKKYNEEYYYSAKTTKNAKNTRTTKSSAKATTNRTQKSKTEIDYQQKRQMQRDRTTSMLEKDRVKVQPTHIEIEQDELENIIKPKKANETTANATIEKTVNMLAEFNKYLQEEKEMLNKE